VATQPFDDDTFLRRIVQVLSKRLPKKPGSYYQAGSFRPMQDIVPTYEGIARGIHIVSKQPAPTILDIAMPLVFMWTAETSVLHISAMLDFGEDSEGSQRAMALEQFAQEHNLSHPELIGYTCFQFNEKINRSICIVMTTVYFPPELLRPKCFSSMLLPLVEGTYRRLCCDAEGFAIQTAELLEAYNIDTPKKEVEEATGHLH